MGFEGGGQKRLKEKYDVTIAANEDLPRDSNDSTPQTLRLKQANPDVVFVILFQKEAALFLRDAAKYGLSAILVGNTALEDIADLVRKAGTDAVMKNFYAP